MGTDEEERESYVTELIYIHSKVRLLAALAPRSQPDGFFHLQLMICDDRRVIIGSASQCSALRTCA